MWTCPKCGRTFKRTNQGHYCGKAPETVLEYIHGQPQEIQSHLRELRNILQSSVPGIGEKILWSMPYYEKDGNTVSFSAGKKQISFYAGAEAIEKFSSELKEFATKKNAIYFPYEKVLPKELITEIVQWCFQKA